MSTKPTIVKNEDSQTGSEKLKDPAGRDSTISRRLGAMQSIVSRIYSAHTREDILQIIRLEVKWLFDFEICLMGTINRTRSHYIINTLSPVADATDLNHKHFSIDEGMLGWSMRNQATIFDEIESGPVFSYALEGKFQDLGIKSQLIVPMKASGETIGALAFASIKSSAFTEDDAVIAQMLSLVLSSSLTNEAILENTRKHVAQIELLNEVTSQLTSTLQLDELLNAAASSIQKNFNYFDVTVFLLSEDKQELVLEAHAGNFIDFLPHGYRQKIGKGLIGWVVEHGEIVLCNDVSQDPRYMTYEYHNTKSELAIPITIDGEIAGVLNVEDTKLHAFDDTDIMVLETLSDHLGIAIKNAKLYDEVRKTNMKLTEVDKMKSEFLGIVSHDFRSPLSSIILAGKSLLKNESVQGLQRVKEYLQIIVDQANRLNQLAEDTLSITKIESGQLSFYFKIVNIERLVQDAISMVRFSNRHQMTYTVDPNVAFIKGDQTKLRQVVQNLVSNAVKYSPKGGKVCVTVEDYSPEKILVSVSDEGIGIPADQVDKLFKKFSRVNSNEVRDIKGAGLGLWICKEIVEAHGGKIWIESQFGKGSTMKFTINKV